MKNIKKLYFFIPLVLLIIGSYSCGKLLDVELTGKMTSGQFWKNKEQAVAEIMGCYQSLGDREGMTGSPYSSATVMAPLESILFWSEVRGDLMTTNNKYPADQMVKENVHSFNVDPSNIITSYTSIYNIINQTNLVLKHVPEILTEDPSFTKTENDAILGEAYFIRALCYFQLVRAFKDVPYVTEPSETDLQNYSVPKKSGDSILLSIVADLEYAKTALPENYNNVNIVYNQCRATKYAALALQADIYLWMNNYQGCITNCNTIINSKKYSLVLASELKSRVFTIGNSPESIFEIYFSQGLNQINNFKNWFTTKVYFTAVTNTYGALFPDPRDSRAPLRIVYPDVLSTANTDMLNIYSGGITKWEATDSRWVFYRLAEIYLMQAEAQVHLNNGSPADIELAKEMIYSNTFKRAYNFDPLTPLTDQGFPTKTVWMAQYSSVTDMDNLILDERGRELVFEGKRWYDLVRIASRDNYAQKDLLMSRIMNAAKGSDLFSLNARILDPGSWYLPLNADELAANKKLIQNPYYQ
jgi:hypothetical protein